MARGDKFPVVYVDGDVPQLPIQLGQLLVDSSLISLGVTNLQQCTSQDPLVYEPLQGGYPETLEEEAAGVTIVNDRAPPGYVRRYGNNASPGITDMTIPIRDALLVSAFYRTVFDPETYLSGKQIITSGANIYMPPGCLLLDTGVLGVNDRYLNISSEEALGPIRKVHIEAWGAKVQLIKANYGTGEQRHALSILGDVADISVLGLECIDAGGDGICVGGLGGGLPDTPERIRLIGIKSDNSRRNGLSITAGKDVKVYAGTFINTTGTSPQYGIDIEPDQSGGAMVGLLEDIVLDSCYSANNAGGGMASIGGPYTFSGKKVSISFVNCVDNGSNFNFQINSWRSDVDGLVSFINCKGFGALTNGFDCYRSGMKCLIDEMAIFNANQSGQTSERFGSSYAIYSINATDGETYGNLQIRNSYAYGTAALKTITQQIIGAAASVITNVNAEIFTDAAATKRAFYALTSSQVTGLNRIKFTDETALVSASSLSASAFTAYLNNIVTNTGASGAIAYNLSDSLSRLPGVRATLRVGTAQRIEVDPGSGWTIGGGAQLFSDQVGKEVTVESDGTSCWRIVESGEGWYPTPITLANSGTPSVGNGSVFASGGTTTWTNFTNGVQGQDITIFLQHALTIDCTGTNLKGNAGVDISANNGDLLRAIFDGTNWRLTFSDCT